MMCRNKGTLALELLEDRRMLAGTITQIGHFDTWDGGVIPSTDVAGLTYHSPSGHLFLSDSEINEIPEIFNGNNLFEVSLSGDTLHQQYVSNNSEPSGIAYSEFDGYFYITNDNTSMRGFARYDNNLNNRLVSIDTVDDVPNATDPEGITADPATGTLYIADGNLGGTQVLVYDANLIFQYNFSVTSELNDAEGIAFHPSFSATP